MFFILLNFFIILLNFNYISYNEDFLLNLFLILFFILIYIFFNNKIKFLFFSYITKIFYIFTMLINFIYYYNNEYKIFNRLKYKFLNKFILTFKLLRKNLSKVINNNFYKNIYLIRILCFLKNLLDYQLTNDFNFLLFFNIKNKLKVNDIIFFY